MDDQDGGHDAILRILDTDSGKELQVLKLDGVSCAAISPDGKKVVAGSWWDEDGITICRIWDVESGRELQTLTPILANEEEYGCVCIYSIHFSSDGERIVTVNCGYAHRLWDAETGKELQRLEGQFVGFVPDGKKAVTEDDGMLRIWDSVSGKELFGDRDRAIIPQREDEFEFFSSTDFSPDGTKLVAVSYNDATKIDTVRFFDLDSGKELQKWNAMALLFWSARFSPDSKKIVTASFDGTVRIWDANSGEELHLMPGHPVGIFTGGTKGIASNTGGLVSVDVFDSTGEWAGERFTTFSPDGKGVVVVNGNTARLLTLE